MRGLLNRRKILVFLFITFLGLFPFLYWQNNSIVVTEVNYTNSKIPEAFNGFKILHISDLHNKSFGKDNRVLLKKIDAIKPEIILITGDLIDSRRTDTDTALAFIQGINQKIPIYYVTGNHESRLDSYDFFKERLEESGVIVLDQAKVVVTKGESQIELLGIMDPDFFIESDSLYVQRTLSKLMETNDHFKILLSHRPELLDVYSTFDIDLVFSGHAHGGQIRLPFIEGLIAPNQGFFPEFTEGVHTKNNTTLIISRGLGNSIIPQRIFNRPELIVVTLSS